MPEVILVIAPVEKHRSVPLLAPLFGSHQPFSLARQLTGCRLLEDLPDRCWTVFKNCVSWTFRVWHFCHASSAFCCQVDPLFLPPESHSGNRPELCPFLKETSLRGTGFPLPASGKAASSGGDCSRKVHVPSPEMGHSSGLFLSHSPSSLPQVPGTHGLASRAVQPFKRHTSPLRGGDRPAMRRWSWEGPARRACRALSSHVAMRWLTRHLPSPENQILNVAGGKKAQKLAVIKKNLSTVCFVPF